MHIRRIIRTTISASLIGTVVLAGMASGQAAAANEICFEPGPNGLPREVPCPIQIDLLPTPGFIIPGLGEIGSLPSSEPADDDPCTITLPSGIEIPCYDLSGLTAPGLIGSYDDIVVSPIEEPQEETAPVEEDTAAEDATAEDAAAPESDEAPVEEQEAGEVAVEGLDSPESPVDESTVEAPLDEQPSSDLPEDEVESSDIDSSDIESSDIESSDIESSDIVEPETGPLPSTGPAAAGILLGLGLMGIGGGAFAKVAASRRRN